mmetsp:Transcript_18539/g.39820  ORF Transcript_18539/g.39820 Transcript_18539/m.39820 type:complete len:213 (+) Transcript_18539:51-689(+)
MILLRMSALSVVLGASSANGHTSTLRGSANDFNLPDFFPVDMKNDDLELYRNKKNALIATQTTASSFSLIAVDKNNWLRQCPATFAEYWNPATNVLERSNFYLIDEPAGLCADALSCAFAKCHASKNGGSDHSSLGCLFNRADALTISYDDAASACNFPPSALPDSITFPKTAADVVTAIQYARKIVYRCRSKVQGIPTLGLIQRLDPLCST